MKKTFAVLSLAVLCVVGTAVAQRPHNLHRARSQNKPVSNADPAPANPIKRVLLISVDGMHAVDFFNCANGIATVDSGQPFCPNIASLANTGINYLAASTSKPSDSFPGLTAIVTGGSPALTGVYYDVAYSRDLDPPRQPRGTVFLAHLAFAPFLGRQRVPLLSMKKASTSTRPS